MNKNNQKDYTFLNDNNDYITVSRDECILYQSELETSQDIVEHLVLDYNNGYSIAYLKVKYTVLRNA